MTEKVIPAYDRLQYLLQQYTRKRCTPEEMQELFRYLENPAVRELFNNIVDKDFEAPGVAEDGEEIDWEFMYNKIVLGEAPAKRTRIFNLLKIAAAVLILVSAGGAWSHFAARRAAPVLVHVQPQGDALPAANKAVLILADGNTVNLDSAGSGAITRQGTVNLSKAPGHLSYAAATNGSGNPIYNKVATPRGGIFKLTLSDGTNVWLNSASSIRFPVAFSDKERTVEVTGEVYFEVAKQVVKGNPVPFFCKAGNMEVAVLGTHFNINAYNNETDIKTTLLEGAVKIKQGANTKLLQPGQQSLVGKDGQIALSDHVNMDEVMGWKNGYFVFEEANIGQIMREVERWYNLDVEYDGPLPDGRYNGRISRATKVSQVMKVLELSGINFRITGNKIIIKSR